MHTAQAKGLKTNCNTQAKEQNCAHNTGGGTALDTGEDRTQADSQRRKHNFTTTKPELCVTAQSRSTTTAQFIQALHTEQETLKVAFRQIPRLPNLLKNVPRPVLSLFHALFKGEP